LKSRTLQPIDSFARGLDPETRDAIAGSTARRTKSRVDVLREDFTDPDALRRIAGEVKRHTLDHLDQYLEQAEHALRKNGARVHFASDAQAARQAILGILQDHRARLVIKSKSMATEEIHLNPWLEEHGVDCVESDLGEFIVQIDEDSPSHIVQPIIHKNRRQVARSLERHGLGDYDDDPDTGTLLDSFLSGKGFRVSHARSGPEALALLERDPSVDAVSLDYYMHPMNGLKVLRAIRAKSDFDHLPVVMLTSSEDRNVEMSMFEAGADDYVVKPLDPPRYFLRLRAVMRRRQGG